jgi:hypothetical protein
VVAAAVGLAVGASQMREVAVSVCGGGSAAGFCEGEALCSQRKMSGVCGQLKADWRSVGCLWKAGRWRWGKRFG